MLILSLFAEYVNIESNRINLTDLGDPIAVHYDSFRENVVTPFVESQPGDNH